MFRNALAKNYFAINGIKKLLALDISRVTEKNYRVEMERKGFLIPSEYSFEDFEKDLAKIFIVYEDLGKVGGYIIIDEEPELRKTTASKWFSPEFKELYYSHPHAEIGGIALLPQYTKQHIASHLLIEAEKEVKAKGNRYIFSLVAYAPVMNHPSITFHMRNGFRQIALNEPHPLFGMQDYQSILFEKEL